MSILKIIFGLIGAALAIAVLVGAVRDRRQPLTIRLFHGVCALCFIVSGVGFVAQGAGAPWATDTLVGRVLSWLLIPFIVLSIILFAQRRSPFR